MKKRLNIAIILGTRPEIIKMSPVVRECKKRGIEYFILHTNQHFSENMDKIFFKELELPQPQYNLGINSLSHGKMIGKMMIEIEGVLQKEKPRWVLVQGDTNTVMAGATIAQRLGIKVGHVEAGLRSYDRSMPEEINRVVTDHVSDALFCPTNLQREIVINEGIESGKVFVTGNTIVDAVFQNIKLAGKMDFVNKYRNDNYFLLTMHRPSNVDGKSTIIGIIRSLEKAAEKHRAKIIFPIHPRTKNQIRKYNININGKLIKTIDPVGYLEMLILEKYAKLIITDSGGIQEEACILKVPCVTIRDNTERPETVDIGASILVGNKENKIIKGIDKMIVTERSWKNPFGNGGAGKSIIDNLQILSN